MTLNEAIGAEVRATRARLGWRQAELAQKVKEADPEGKGIAQPRISQIERSKGKPVTVVELRCIAAATGTAMLDLVPDVA